MHQPPPPASPPPPPYPYRHRRGGVVWPLLLIGAGVIFLLQNLGLLSWDVWGSIGQFWPVILILIGLELFLGGGSRHRLGAAVGGLLTLAVISAIAVAAYGHFTTRGDAAPVARTFTQALQGASSAGVTVRFGAGNLNVGAEPGESDTLAGMTYNGPGQLAPRASYRVRDGQGQLAYNIQGSGHFPFGGNRGGGDMTLLLNQQTPLTLDVQEGASSGKIDLSHLHVGAFNLQTGASHITVVMPESAGATNASIKGGASTIDIQVPDGVAAQIQYEGGLSTVDVDQGRFPAAGDRMYRSANYDSAQNRVDITVQAGLATVSVR